MSQNLLQEFVELDKQRRYTLRLFADLSPEIALAELAQAHVTALRLGVRADIAQMPRDWRKRLANVKDG